MSLQVPDVSNCCNSVGYLQLLTPATGSAVSVSSEAQTQSDPQDYIGITLLTGDTPSLSF